MTECLEYEVNGGRLGFQDSSHLSQVWALTLWNEGFR